MESRKKGTENMQINIMINITCSLYLTLVSAGTISNTQGYCYVHINKNGGGSLSHKTNMT